MNQEDSLFVSKDAEMPNADKASMTDAEKKHAAGAKGQKFLCKKCQRETPCLRLDLQKGHPTEPISGRLVDIAATAATADDEAYHASTNGSRRPKLPSEAFASDRRKWESYRLRNNSTPALRGNRQANVDGNGRKEREDRGFDNKDHAPSAGDRLVRNRPTIVPIFTFGHLDSQIPGLGAPSPVVPGPVGFSIGDLAYMMGGADLYNPQEQYQAIIQKMPAKHIAQYDPRAYKKYGGALDASDIPVEDDGDIYEVEMSEPPQQIGEFADQTDKGLVADGHERLEDDDYSKSLEIEEGDGMEMG
ncbi:hypothetical protein H2203_002679 [Taxawa tesnikishii (nom. ined.)]|nr:hypothetical protein H2203_002679 [Dothideales sp. JES 119]